MRHNWSCAGIEPPLEDALDEPIVHLVMRRDGVSREELVLTVQEARSRLRFRERGGAARRPESAGPVGSGR